MRTPDVTLVSPTSVVTGEEYEFEIVVDCGAPTRVNGITARLRGKQGWAHRSSGFQNHPQRDSFIAPDRTVELSSKASLTGVTRYSQRFAIPQHTSPTHSLEWAYGWLELLVRIEMPWWRSNHVKRFDLPVLRPRPPAIARKSAVATSTSVTPSDPRLEIAVASSVLIPGERLAGACAVFHVDGATPREVKIELEPIIEFNDGSSVVGRTAAMEKLVVAPEQAGTTIPFAFGGPTCHAAQPRVHHARGSLAADRAPAGDGRPREDRDRPRRPSGRAGSRDRSRAAARPGSRRRATRGLRGT